MTRQCELAGYQHIADVSVFQPFLGVPLDQHDGLPPIERVARSHRNVFRGLHRRLNRFRPLDLFGVEIGQSCSAEGANQPQSQGGEACDDVDCAAEIAGLAHDAAGGGR